MSITVIQWIILIFGTLLLLIISWRALFNLRSHGFYRFFTFEACLVLVILNLPFWILNPFSVLQIISWILLFNSILMVALGTVMLKKLGRPSTREKSPETYHFEDTSVLVKEGIYRYIRHPMYSSLLFLAWGAWLKHPTPVSTLILLMATVAVFSTARIEEAENLKTFGPDYQSYINQTKMFIPLVF